MKVKKIAIIGGGNGGATAAADIASRGFSVSWFELPEFASNLEEAKNKGGLTFITKEGSQFVKIDTISTNLTEVMDGADVVMLAVPTNVIEEFAKLCAPHIEAGQIILINSAACAGSFRFARVAQRLGITTKFLIAETNSLAYGTRFDARKAEVNMLLRTKKLHLAAFPSSDTESVLAACRQFYEFLVPAKNVWETTLNNGNPESHTGPGLLNAGRIEYSKGEFYLYKEGITEHTVNLVKAVDNERQAICKELGFEAIPKEERVVQMGYAKPLKTLQEQYNTSEVYSKIKGPTSVTNRYFIEDISNGLVMWSSLAKAIGVATPVIDALITLGSELLKIDFWEKGVTLESIGLGGMNKKELVSAVS
jgi:opine dehydrogenase